MQNLNDFFTKLHASDLLIFTSVNEDRYYCRFYHAGIYKDRVFVSNIPLLEDLKLLNKEDGVIDIQGVEYLKNKYSRILEFVNL